MIRIIKNTPEQITFEKDSRQEKWFDNNCSEENLLKECGRANEKVKRIKFEDGNHIASLLHVYFDLSTVNEPEKLLTDEMLNFIEFLTAHKRDEIEHIYAKWSSGF